MEHALRAFRHSTDPSVSLADLADRAGTTKATLSKIENGLLSPSLDLVRRIIDATGGAVTANDFLPVVEAPPLAPEHGERAGADA